MIKDPLVGKSVKIVGIGDYKGYVGMVISVNGEEGGAGKDESSA